MPEVERNWNPPPKPPKNIEELTARLGEICKNAGNKDAFVNEVHKLHADLTTLHTNKPEPEPEEDHKKPAKHHR